MLITFTSKVHPDVVMFGDIATVFLTAMGESEQAPGILRGANIKLAADRLRAWLNRLPAEKTSREVDDAHKTEEEIRELQNRIGLKKRALPLLELMDAAYQKDSDLIWC